MANVKVRALRAHNNTYGEQITKAKGDTYDLPEAQADALRQVGFVELVKADAEAKAK